LEASTSTWETDHVLLGQWEESAAEFREVVRLQPDRFDGYNNLGQAYISLNRIDDAQAVCVAASSHKIDVPNLHDLIYMVAFLKNDQTAMQQQLKWALGKPITEGIALFQESATSAYLGKLAKARELSRAAEAEAMRDDARETAASFYSREAIREAEFGNEASAQHMAQKALVLSESRDVRIQAALALSATGDSRRARKLAQAITKDFPLDTLVQSYWVPTILAQIQLIEGHADQSLDLLQQAKALELTYQPGAEMHAAYIRGQAYLAMGNAAASAGEFQKIIDHRGLVLNDATGSLAHLWLGRARALEARSGPESAVDAAKSQSGQAYQDFFALWKDADPDIPILKQAKAEYAKLQ
jgi:tetratricopeptide (TPR) repeat protein